MQTRTRVPPIVGRDANADYGDDYDLRELIAEYRQTGACSDTNKFMLQVLALADAAATTLALVRRAQIPTAGVS